MLEIKFDPSTLTKAQREDLASFILGFEIDDAPIATAITDGSAVVQDPSHIQQALRASRDIKEGQAVYYAKDIDPNAVFGAPSSAGADPSLTAQEVTPATTSTQPLTAPLPPVPNNVTPGTIAAPQSQNLAEVDKRGMRWDARIHSSSKAKIADGTWKYRRGVTDEEIKKVEGELMGSPHVPSHVDFDPATRIPVQPGPSIAQLVDPAVDPVALRQQFAQLMLKVAKSKGEGKLTAEEVTAALQPYGVASLPLLANKLEVVPQVTAAIDAILASKG